jgi:hypothetical protein
MSWPEYEYSQLFNEDPVMLSIKESMLNLLKKEDPAVIELSNIQQKKYISSSYKTFNKAFSLYFNPCEVFSPELHSIFLRRNRILYIDSLKKGFYKRRTPNTISSISLKKGDICTLLYLPNIEKLEGIENCHTLADYLHMALPIFKGVTSYCQKAFFECKENETTFDENTTLSYGHNTLREKELLPVNSVYLYNGNQAVRIFIYSKKLILVIVNKNLKLYYKDNTLKGKQVSQILNSLIFNYVSYEQ